ncbi:MAG: DNA primase [Methanocalculaceae archaeon]|jgi:DNA primase|nr:DNA primase [Methanocalculaceae archaeon]
MYSPDAPKYLIHIHIETEGVVEKPDVIGAIFGQTEGLLGEDMDLRDLQRSGRVGRIDVQITSTHGKTVGELYIASSLDRAETAILAASLETIERVGPCVSTIKVQGIEDLRVIKRRQIVNRAKELLLESFDDVGISTNEILTEVRESIRVEKISSIGEERLPAGPNVPDSDALIIVEGRADVLNLLKCGIKNTVAVEGTKVPQIIVDLSIKKNTTVFVDGDRGGDLILRELLQVADIDYVAFSPRSRNVEDMSRKEIVKSLRNKVPADVWRTQNVRDESVADMELEPAGDMASVLEPERMAPTIIPEEPPFVSVPDPDPVAAATTGPIGSAFAEKMNVPMTATKQPIRPLSAEPRTIAEHADYMQQTGKARVLTGEGAIYGDYALSEMYDILSKFKGDLAGLIIDEVVNQRFVDIAAEKGLKFIVAKGFEGIVRRPVSIRMSLL